MTFISLFAGIGGFDLGLERAGMRCVFQVEVDPYCRRVLERHWPEVPKRGDIRLVDPADLPRADLICGGFPCQDISSARTASPRRGLLGRKSGLWSELRRIVGTVQPSWVVVENSPRWRAWVPTVRADLSRDGYASLPVVLSAGQMGAPHSRPRGFVVAHADSTGESLRAFHAEASRTCPDAGRAWPAPPTERHRVDDGLSRRLALKALGNAVVPQVAEVIGRAIQAASVKAGRE